MTLLQVIHQRHRVFQTACYTDRSWAAGGSFVERKTLRSSITLKQGVMWTAEAMGRAGRLLYDGTWFKKESMNWPLREVFASYFLLSSGTTVSSVEHSDLFIQMIEHPRCYIFTCPEVKHFLRIRYTLRSRMSMHKRSLSIISYFSILDTCNIYWWCSAFDILYKAFAPGSARPTS